MPLSKSTLTPSGQSKFWRVCRVTNSPGRSSRVVRIRADWSWRRIGLPDLDRTPEEGSKWKGPKRYWGCGEDSTCLF